MYTWSVSKVFSRLRKPNKFQKYRKLKNEGFYDSSFISKTVERNFFLFQMVGVKEVKTEHGLAPCCRKNSPANVPPKYFLQPATFRPVDTSSCDISSLTYLLRL